MSQQRELFGRDPSGNLVPVHLDADGNLLTSESGDGSATTIADGADVALGSTTDVAVSTDANGTVSAKLRGLIVLLVNYLSRFPTSLGQKTAANSLPVTLPSDQAAIPGSIANGANVVEGSTTDVAVTTDANGTISAKLRGLIVLTLQVLARLPSALTGSGNFKVAIQESTTLPVSDNAGSLTIDSSQLPTALTGSGNIKTSIQESITLPVSDNNGSLTVDSLQLPATLGIKTAANSLPVTLPSDQAALAMTTADGSDAALGAKADAAASSDAGTFSLIALVKRLLGKLPTALGQQTRANSFSVTQASDATGANAPEFKQTNGTNIQDIISPASGQNSALVAGSHMTVSASTTTVQAIATTDAGNYAWVSVHILSQGTNSVVTPQISNDNTNWTGIALLLSSGGNTAATTQPTGTGIYHGPLTARYFRLNVTGISGGTTSVAVVFSAIPRDTQTIGTHTNIAQYAGNTSATSGDARTITTLLPALQHASNGATADAVRTATMFKVVSLAAGTAETTIWTPAGGKKFRLMGFILTPGAASTLTFKDGTGGTTIFAARGTTDVSIISPGTMGNGILSAAANNVLTVTRGTSCTLDGVVWGTEE